MQVQAEAKLFVGGIPPAFTEEEIRQIFSPYGEVEEVFLMRGGSRSGMACCFVRFSRNEDAASAIQGVHGKVVPEGASEPLVVRYADSPGSGRGRRARGQGGQGAGAQGGLPGGVGALMPGGLGVPGFVPGYGVPLGALPRGAQDPYLAAAAAYGLHLGMLPGQGGLPAGALANPAAMMAAAGQMGFYPGPLLPGAGLLQGGQAGLAGGAGGGAIGAAGGYGQGPQAGQGAAQGQGLGALGGQQAGMPGASQRAGAGAVPGAGSDLPGGSALAQAQAQAQLGQFLHAQALQSGHLQLIQQLAGMQGGMPTAGFAGLSLGEQGQGQGQQGQGPGLGGAGLGGAGLGGLGLGGPGLGGPGLGGPGQQPLAGGQGQPFGLPFAGQGGSREAIQPPTSSEESDWAPYTAPDGRTYYYNAKKGVSTWVKPQ
mmetsp:Transcript_568/g.1737  ORF Transcript_568/g.1737 Transcript_568/m.1737 type:complete len:426 (+) Transcript_568:85-1362(+)